MGVLPGGYGVDLAGRWRQLHELPLIDSGEPHL